MLLRESVPEGGTPLLFMPSFHYQVEILKISQLRKVIAALFPADEIALCILSQCSIIFREIF